MSYSAVHPYARWDVIYIRRQHTSYLLAILGCTVSCSEDPAITLRQEADTLIAEADAASSKGEHRRAERLYAKAWNKSRGETGVRSNERVFFILLSALNANFLRGDFKAGLSVAGLITKAFDGEVFVGNPLFHLRLGQCKFEVAQEDEKQFAVEDLSRALLGAGVPSAATRRP